MYSKPAETSNEQGQNKSGNVTLFLSGDVMTGRGIEIYNGRPILFGCGDLINDYEGISGHEQFRDDLSLLYFVKLNRDGKLISLRMSPMQIYRFRL